VDVAAAVALLPTMRAAGLRLAELVLDDGLELVLAATGLPAPLGRRWPAYVLVETDTLPALPAGADAVVDPRLLAYRERLPEAVATLGVPHKLDVAVPLEHLATLVAALPGLVAPHRVVVFGHLAEGNLHVQILGPAPDDDRPDEAVLGAVAALGGTIAAEHGVGRAKAGLLPLVRGAADRAAMRAVKQALDPEGLLNPGVVLPE
jgi:FAD/FMN-containing dehydrogenase